MGPSGSPSQTAPSGLSACPSAAFGAESVGERPTRPRPFRNPRSRPCRAHRGARLAARGAGAAQRPRRGVERSAFQAAQRPGSRFRTRGGDGGAAQSRPHRPHARRTSAQAAAGGGGRSAAAWRSPADRARRARLRRGGDDRDARRTRGSDATVQGADQCGVARHCARASCDAAGSQPARLAVAALARLLRRRRGARDCGRDQRRTAHRSHPARRSVRRARRGAGSRTPARREPAHPPPRGTLDLAWVCRGRLVGPGRRRRDPRAPVARPAQRNRLRSLRGARRQDFATRRRGRGGHGGGSLRAATETVSAKICSA